MRDPDIRRWLVETCQRAGVLPEEMFDHPEHGLCVNLSGVEKIAKIMPPTAEGTHMLNAMRLAAMKAQGSA